MNSIKKQKYLMVYIGSFDENYHFFSVYCSKRRNFNCHLSWGWGSKKGIIKFSSYYDVMIFIKMIPSSCL